MPAESEEDDGSLSGDSNVRVDDFGVDPVDSKRGNKKNFIERIVETDDATTTAKFLVQLTRY